MTATIALVESVRRGAPARRLWLLPAVMLPWVNMHGLYFLGPALFWSAAAGAAIDRRLGRDFFGNIGNLPTRGAVLAMLATSPLRLGAGIVRRRTRHARPGACPGGPI